MANVVVDESCLSAIASAIRSKNGLSTTYLPGEMASAVAAIESGGSGPANPTDAAATFSQTVASGSAAYVRTCAFMNCATIQSLELPQCSYVESSAFQNCASLEGVSLPTCTTIQFQAFRGCQSLSSLSIPSCSYVGSSAFQNCAALSTLSLPACETLGSNALRSCFSLVSLYLTSVSSVPTLGAGVFTSTPIGGYSASTGTYGSVYVPGSLYAAFRTAANWSSISARIVSV